jgi:hypothetical protein
LGQLEGLTLPASVVFPNVGDGLFELTFGGITQTVAAQFFFPAGGVSQFSVRGIETSAGLDPGNVTAFITGLTWVGLGEFTGTMTPVIQFVPARPCRSRRASCCSRLASPLLPGRHVAPG